ncbi:hypothetical protein [Pseudomonas sp. S60]|uniref:hypothetical protein n=1 Tax=Pseudomonas sp. S60 TaxID=211124 RepID=UPI0019125FC5|nr:hypothetical protein [Pseudomonas sp. S60]
MNSLALAKPGNVRSDAQQLNLGLKEKDLIDFQNWLRAQALTAATNNANAGDG